MSKMLYRPGSEIEYQGAWLDTFVAEDVDEALADGWFHIGDLYDAEGKFIPPDAVVAPETAEPGFLDQSAAKIIESLPGATKEDLEGWLTVETAGKSRKGVLSALEAALKALSDEP